jgi:diphthine-ammonia ligase
MKTETLRKAAADYGINHGIYGDIDIQSHRDWEEKVSNLAGEG